MADDLVTNSDGLGGRPGERWRNMTGDTWYQLGSSLRKPCAVCLRRRGRISPRPWPIPFHPNCQCEQLEIPAGCEVPIEFRSAGELAAAMPVGGQVELVGALNSLIRSAGLVSWDDLFDAGGDPRDFEDVVRRKGLTLEQLRRAGVAEDLGPGGLAGAAGEVMARRHRPEVPKVNLTLCRFRHRV